MNPRVTPHLPESLLDVLKNGCPSLLLTVGEDGFPASAFTWALGLSATVLRFGADLGSATLANLERERRASLQVIGEGNLVFLIKGTARPIKPRMEAAPLKVALWQIEVKQAKDQSWPGVSLRPFGYDWSPEQREKMLAMERAVYAEMREGPMAYG